MNVEQPDQVNKIGRAKKFKTARLTVAALVILGLSTGFTTIKNTINSFTVIPLAPFFSQLDMVDLIAHNYVQENQNDILNNKVSSKILRWWGKGGVKNGKVRKENGYAITVLYDYFYEVAGLKNYGMMSLSAFAAKLGLPTTRSSGGGNCTTPDGNISFCNTNPDPNISGDTNYNPNWGNIKSTIPMPDSSHLTTNYLDWSFNNPAHYDAIDFIIGYVVQICTGVTILPGSFNIPAPTSPIFSQQIFSSGIYTHGIIYSIMCSVFSQSYPNAKNVQGVSWSWRYNMRGWFAVTNVWGYNGDYINDPNKNFTASVGGCENIDGGGSFINEYGLIIFYYINYFANAFNESIEIKNIHDGSSSLPGYAYVEKVSRYGTDDFGKWDGFAANPLNFWAWGKLFRTNPSYYLWFTEYNYLRGYRRFNTQSPYNIPNSYKTWYPGQVSLTEAIWKCGLYQRNLDTVWNTQEIKSMQYNGKGQIINSYLGKIWNPWHKVDGSIDFYGPALNKWNTNEEPFIVADYTDSEIPNFSAVNNQRYIKFAYSSIDRVYYNFDGWRYLEEDGYGWKNGNNLWVKLLTFGDTWPKNPVNSYHEFIAIYNLRQHQKFDEIKKGYILELEQLASNSRLGYNTETPMPTNDAIANTFSPTYPSNIDTAYNALKGTIETAAQEQKSALGTNKLNLITSLGNGDLNFTSVEGARIVKPTLAEIDALANRQQCQNFESNVLNPYIADQSRVLGVQQQNLATDFANADRGYTVIEPKLTLAEIKNSSHNKATIDSLRNNNYSTYNFQQQQAHSNYYNQIQSEYDGLSLGYDSTYGLKPLADYANKAALDAMNTGTQKSRFSQDQQNQFNSDKIKLNTEIGNADLGYTEHLNGNPLQYPKQNVLNRAANVQNKNDIDAVRNIDLVNYGSEQNQILINDVTKLKNQFKQFDLGYTPIAFPQPDYSKLKNKYDVDEIRQTVDGVLEGFKKEQIYLRNQDIQKLETEFNTATRGYMNKLDGTNLTYPLPDFSTGENADPTIGWHKSTVDNYRNEYLPKYTKEQNDIFGMDLQNLKNEFAKYNLGYGSIQPDFTSYHNKNDIDNARNNTLNDYKNGEVLLRNNAIDSLIQQYQNASLGYTQDLNGNPINMPNFDEGKNANPDIGWHKNTVDNYLNVELPKYKQHQIDVRNEDVANVKHLYDDASNGYVKKANGNRLDNPIPDFNYLYGKEGVDGGTKQTIDYWRNRIDSFHAEQLQIYSEDLAAKDPAILRIDEVITYLNTTFLYPGDNYGADLNTISNLNVDLGMGSVDFSFFKNNYGYLHYIQQNGVENHVRYILLVEYGIYFIADHNTQNDTWTYKFYNQQLGGNTTYSASIGDMSLGIVQDPDVPSVNIIQISGNFKSPTGQTVHIKLSLNFTSTIHDDLFPTPIIDNPYAIVHMTLDGPRGTDSLYASISKPFGSKRVIQASGTYNVNDPNAVPSEHKKSVFATKDLNYFWHVYATTSGQYFIAVDILYNYLSLDNDPSKATYAGGRINILDYSTGIGGIFEGMDSDDVVSNLPEIANFNLPVNVSAPSWLGISIVSSVVGIIFIPAIFFGFRRVRRKAQYVGIVNKIEQEEAEKILAKKQQRMMSHKKQSFFSIDRLRSSYRKGKSSEKPQNDNSHSKSNNS